MPTIKDIAREAGVAQGTVSNVLNGKGNVSSDKILLVEQTAARLGYTINQRAKTLRKGSSCLLAAILPNMYDRRYTDFFLSFKNYAEQCGYSVRLYLSNDVVQNEIAQLAAVRSEMGAGIATFSCFASGSNNAYAEAGFSEQDVVFVERDPFQSPSYIGFDYEQAGREMADVAIEKSYHNILLVTENLSCSSQRAFYNGFMAQIKGHRCGVHHIQTDMQHGYNHYLQLLSEVDNIDAAFLSNYSFAETFSDINKTFYPHLKPEIYSLSPLFTMPSVGSNKYELNYRLMGRTAARMLINRKTKPEENTPKPMILHNEGIRTWVRKTAPTDCKRLTILTLDSPTDRVMENVAHLYTDATGIEIKIAICSYDGVHEVLSGLGKMDSYDVIRLDHTWLSFFGENIFTPLKELDPDIESTFSGFMPGLVPKYTSVNHVIYALPETPSAQLLFYRKDLFDNAVVQRLYKERYKEDFALPKDFAHFNRIARFFTRSFNENSPTTYGTTMTLGNSGVAATEYLTRYFSYSHDLFDRHGNLMLNKDYAEQAMRDLIEARDYSPKRFNSWWRETAKEFAAGDTAMTILFSNYASEMLSSDSAIIDKIGYTTLPGENSLLGGGCIGVCKNSQHKKEAFDFIKWMCSEEITTAMTLLGSISPCEKTYSNYEVLDTYPWLSLSRKCIMQSVTNRIPPQKTSGFDERRFLSILGAAVNNVYNDTSTAKDALDYAIEAYNMILK